MDISEILCNNCKRDIPAANADLHLTHCLKFMKLCELCNDPYPIKEFEQHILEDHQEVKCEKCRQTYQQGDEEIHESVCSMAPVKCDFCDTECHRKDISGHIERCGTRTDACDFCDDRVMLKDMLTHVCRTRESAVEEDNKGYSQTRSFPHNGSVSLEPYLDSYQPPTTNIGANYLDELISTTHFDPLNGSTVDLDAALAAQLAHDDQRNSEQRNNFKPADLSVPSARARQLSTESVFPCEFCETMLPLEDLMLHQSACFETSISDTRPAPPPQLPPTNKFEDGDYIPCEFCCKQFPFSLIDQHQAGCTPTRRVPSYSELVDTRSIVEPVATEEHHRARDGTMSRYRPPPLRSNPPVSRGNKTQVPSSRANQTQPASTRDNQSQLPSSRINSNQPRANHIQNRATSRVAAATKRNLPNSRPNNQVGSPTTTDNETEQTNVRSTGPRPGRKEGVAKPKTSIGGVPRGAPRGAPRGKERARNTSTRGGTGKNNINDLDRASTSKDLPAVVVPKRKTYVSHRNGKNTSSSDNNASVSGGPDSWSNSTPKPQNRSTPVASVDISVRGTKSVNGKLHQSNQEFNNFVGGSKETNEGKDVSINIPSSAENLRTRQNILNKYQKENKFVNKPNGQN